MKGGRLIGQDKGTAISDREFEGLSFAWIIQYYVRIC